LKNVKTVKTYVCGFRNQLITRVVFTRYTITESQYRTTGKSPTSNILLRNGDTRKYWT